MGASKAVEKSCACEREREREELYMYERVREKVEDRREIFVCRYLVWCGDLGLLQTL